MSQVASFTMIQALKPQSKHASVSRSRILLLNATTFDFLITATFDNAACEVFSALVAIETFLLSVPFGPNIGSPVTATLIVETLTLCQTVETVLHLIILPHTTSLPGPPHSMSLFSVLPHMG